MGDNAFYFGCWKEPGHYLFDVNGRYSERRIPADFPVVVNMLDGGFLPPGQPKEYGRAAFGIVNGWTIISFPDSSIDLRPGSSSTFLFRGHFGFAAACELAKERFPSVWNRYTFLITCEY